MEEEKKKDCVVSYFDSRQREEKNEKDSRSFIRLFFSFFFLEEKKNGAEYDDNCRIQKTSESERENTIFNTTSCKPPRCNERRSSPLFYHRGCFVEITRSRLGILTMMSNRCPDNFCSY